MFLKRAFLFSFIFLLIASPALAAIPDGGGQGLFITKSPSLAELGTVIARVINFLLGIVGAITIILIIVGGLRYMMAGGDPKATDAARSQITFAVIGLVIVLLAVFIVNLVGTTLGIDQPLNIINLIYRGNP